MYIYQGLIKKYNLGKESFPEKINAHIYIIFSSFFCALIFSETWIDCQKLDFLFKYFISITFVRVSYFQSKNFNEFP